ncbi:uncharacterized protein TNIN_130101 [Trichonephila inaurata madagascariensis]|uniref:Uncharacterized protein n=1 Tax=Trichonephila inaurata madagascariensis TaxID=2747483 RepID=A0A8X7C114_9ARAC|nr:uncharacterized protein TNIN_130101 [Trichonephila inaurata madagascariensis]
MTEHLDRKTPKEIKKEKLKTLTPLSFPQKVTSPPVVPAVASCPSIVKLESRLSTGDTRNPDAAYDEGLVSDSEVGPGAYVTAYVSCVTSSPSSKSSGRPGHFRSASDNVTSATSLLIPEVRMKKTSSAERLWSTVSSKLNGTEKRKRRKGIGSKQPDGSTVQESPVKSGTGRSLTYPPQRKSSTSEEEQEYTSVDSNGLKSLKLLTAGLMGSEADGVRLLSDLSLADSHLCPSESTVDETYQDVGDSVMHSPSETQYLSVDEHSSSGNGKPLKKKHHSDPGGEACSPGPGDGFMADTIGSSRSEPELGGNDALTTISSSCSSASSETSSRATQTSDQHSNDPQHHQLKLVIDGHVPRGGQGNWHGRIVSSGSLTSGATPTSRFLFPDLDSSSQRSAIENNSASKSPQEQRRYSKRRLRGPYGEMLEEEMRKSGEKQKSAYSDLSFLQEICDKSKTQDASTTTEKKSHQQNRPTMFVSSQSLDDDSTTSSRNELSMCVTPKRKISANYPLLTDGDIPVPIASDEDVSSNRPTPEAPGPKLEKSIEKDNTDSKTASQQKPKTEPVRPPSQDRHLVVKPRHLSASSLEDVNEISKQRVNITRRGDGTFTTRWKGANHKFCFCQGDPIAEELGIRPTV